MRSNFSCAGTHTLTPYTEKSNSSGPHTLTLGLWSLTLGCCYVLRSNDESFWVSFIVLIKKVFEFGLKNDSQLPASDQLELWVSFIQFIRNSWNDLEEIKEVEARFRKAFHHQNILTNDFKTKAKIKKMKRSEGYEYPDFKTYSTR